MAGEGMGVYKRTEYHKNISRQNLAANGYKNAGKYVRTKRTRRHISEATKKQWRDGQHDGQSADMLRRWKEDDGTWAANISKGVSKRLRKDWKNPEYREARMRGLRSGRYISKPQQKLYDLIKTLFPSAVLEYKYRIFAPIDNKHYSFDIDIAIPDRYIAIEVDGRYWHSRPGIKEKDDNRDFILWNYSWRVYRIVAEDVEKDFRLIIGEIVYEELENYPDISEDLYERVCTPVVLRVLAGSYPKESYARY